VIGSEMFRWIKGRAIQRGNRMRWSAATKNVQLSSVLINVILIFMLGLSVLLILMALGQVHFTVGKESSSWGAKVSYCILRLLVDEGDLREMGGAGRAALIGTLVSAIGAIVTAVFAVVAWLISRTVSNAKSLDAPITNLPVYDPDGLDDIAVMIREYSSAQSVTVFGGDFSWMRGDKHPPDKVRKIRALVKQLASSKKIRFISYRTELVVEKSIGADLSKEIASVISYNEKLVGLRASFIVSPHGRVLIYKVHTDLNEMHICRVSDRNKDGKELLDQFGLLIGTL